MSTDKSVLLSGFIPREPEEISADWLFEVINQYRSFKDCSLVRHPDDLVQCEIVERKSSHAYTSSTYIVGIHFKCFTSMGLEQCKYSFFLKLLPSASIPGCDPGYKLSRSAKFFQREVEAHFRVLTHLKKIWNDKSSPYQNGNYSWTSLDITTPEIVYGSYNEAGNGVIVLQDVTNGPGAFTPVAHYLGLNLSQLLCIVEHLSAIHACATATLIKDPNDDHFNHLVNETTDRSECLQNEVSQLLRLFVRFLKIVPGYREQAEVFEKHRPTLVSLLIKSTRKSSTFPLRTVVHGELWDRNFLLRKKSVKSAYINPHEAEVQKVDFEPQDDEEKLMSLDNEESIDLEVMFTDWKNMHIASPSVDLAFLMYSSCSRTIRDQHGKQILEKYYLNFTECLRTKFEVNVPQKYPNFDFEAFLKDYETNQFLGFLQAACLMIRELRHLESEFSYVSPDKAVEKEKAGIDLRDLGRRLIDIADEFVPKIGTPEWNRILSTTAANLNKDP